MTEDLIFKIRKEPGRLGVEFSSTMDFIDSVDEEVKKMLNESGLSKHSFGVRIVLREGLTNAVRHGNKSHREKLVIFDLEINNRYLTMRIEDEGDGFDWASVSEKGESGDEEGTPLDHGRGTPIIKEYFDDHFYNEKGNILTLKKDISS